MKELIKKAIQCRTLTVDCDNKELQHLNIKRLIIRNDLGGAINIDSPEFLKALIEISEEELKESFPTKIVGISSYIDRYEKRLQEKEATKIFNAYHFLTKPFKLQALLKLHVEGRDNLIEFFKNRLNGEEDSSGFYDFEDYFFGLLPKLNLDEQELSNILSQCNEISRKKMRIVGGAYQFVNQYAKCNLPKAIDLYKVGKENIEKWDVIFVMLQAALYNNGFDKVFEDAKTFLQTKPFVLFDFLGRIDYREESIISYALSLWHNVDTNNPEEVCSYIAVLERILRVKNLPSTTIETIFQYYFESLQINEKTITNFVLHTLIWLINSFEEERYNLFKAALQNKLIEDSVIKDYFRNFENPSFFLEFFEAHCVGLKGRFNVKFFEAGFGHFLNSHWEPTEQIVLRLLGRENIHVRLGILKLLMNSRVSSRRINLLAIENEIEQLRAIEAIVKLPYGIEESLPSLLLLRNSSYPNVVHYLQQTLCVLIFEAYHHYLYELIQEHLERSQEDKKFNKPIRDCLGAYEKLRELKRTHDDLNPIINEKSLMQLFYKTEAERNAKMMDDLHSDEHSLMGQIGGKPIIIVRGNAWKIEGRPVSKLGRFESSVSVDARAFKDPDDFEMKLNFPQADF